ncbi:5,6-dimethylbenzimidazole synthase [Bradyrhizobium sp. CCBAU 51627]|uniref:5,6-dimethylbenzimidazole synthase n=1 Tax=Bradyrhizobium sp. CCBAU 51627 TaxID=1325088 RepID=UPI00230526DE|nr:5,6-dimethylbenzimidazole synthase [Bradyrhizobium sp. CCBAU 51627]MDA9430604.1 cob(II)yrinic acid a,c-diamide reductase [Bradyrhizobium sp. CCBAU 51627]
MVAFDDIFRRQLRELFVWRRDVRHFRTTALPDGAVERLIATACLSPSVGLSQPWRFVIVDDAARRRAVIDDFKACNADALNCYSGERAGRYAALKLSGLEQAPAHLAVFADKASDIGHGLGRTTMPETTEYSVVAAITAMWLAARAEGIGLGWVSILNPERIHEVLDVPTSWKFIAYLCIGYPEAECDQPELEKEKWEHRRSAQEFTLKR